MEQEATAAPSTEEPALLTVSDSPLDDGDILDVVVVGAGLSGLTAAYELQKAGITRFKIIEANGEKYFYLLPLLSSTAKML